MKTLKLKMLVAGIAASFFILTGAMPAGSESPASSPNGRFEKENMDIRRDISNISLQKEKIQSLKEAYRLNRRVGNQSAMNANQAELKKAKADLQKYKSYLVADKKDLRKAHNLVINERRKELGKDRNNLSASRRKLNHELANGNEAAAQECVAAVIRRQNEVKNDKMALRNAKTDRNENILAVNKEIKKSNGQFQGVLTAENTVAHVDNWMSDKLLSK